MGSSLYSSSLTCGCNQGAGGGGGGGGGSAAPPNGSVQFNSGNSFGGAPDVFYDTGTNRLVVKALLVTGTGFIENVAELYIGDPLITLNSGVSPPNTDDIGIIGIQGGVSNNVGLVYRTTMAEWVFCRTNDNGSTRGNINVIDYQNMRAAKITGTIMGAGTVYANHFHNNSYPISLTPPSDGYVLGWSGDNTEWTPMSISEAGGISSSSTGCAAGKSCDYFTGSVLGHTTGNGQTLDDGDVLSWDTASNSWHLVDSDGFSTDPGGANTNVQFNNGGTFDGDANFTYDGTTTYIAGALGVGTATPTTVGLIRATNDVVAFYSSDKNLKDNIQPIDSAVDKLKAINGVEFDWIPKEGVHENEGHDVGVIAQEVEKVLPEVVTTRENGYKAVRYEKLVPLLIEAIKEQQAEIDALKGLNKA